MTEQSTQRPITVIRSIATFAAIAVTFVGLLVLAGWALGQEAFKSIVPGTVAMKANTALCLVLGGIALLLAFRESRQSGQRHAYWRL